MCRPCVWVLVFGLPSCGARSDFLPDPFGDGRAPGPPGDDTDDPSEDPRDDPDPPPWRPDPCAAPDRDFDGYESAACGGDDCDDHQSSVHPGASDVETGWHEQYPDRDHVVCCSTSLAVDAAGVVHVAYYSSRELRYMRILEASPDVVETDREMVEASGPPGTGYASMALDAGGFAHVAHLYLAGWDRDDEGELRYSTNATGQWETEVVDVRGDTGYEPDLAIDASGVVHVVYYEATGGDLEYARRDGEGWTFQTADVRGDTGYDPSIAVAPDGSLHVLYQDLDALDLRHATNESGAWEAETVDAGEIDEEGEDLHAGKNPALAVDPDGVLHVAYGREAAGGGFRLWYATGGWGAWTIERVVEESGTGTRSAISVDPSGAVHVASTMVLPGPDEELHLAVLDAGRWSAMTFEVGMHGGMYPSIGFGPDGRTHMTHIDKGLEDLGYVFEGHPDGIDQNCDGVDGLDLDGDGFAASGTGGDDCDDTDPGVNPGEEDRVGDGRDRDCDGMDG